MELGRWFNWMKRGSQWVFLAKNEDGLRKSMWKFRKMMRTSSRLGITILIKGNGGVKIGEIQQYCYRETYRGSKQIL